MSSATAGNLNESRILKDIIAYKKQEVSALSCPPSSALQPSDRNFLEALRVAKGHAIIAELKAKSPSEGIICSDYRPASIAQQYQAGGATCLSVLTDQRFFGGDLRDLTTVRAAVSLPILCKEFIIDTRQIQHARLAGADACLLIVRILTDTELYTLYQEVLRWQMTPLVEVYNTEDCHRAIALGASLIGVNNRNLDTLVMDTNNAHRLQNYFSKDTLVFSLSGAKTPADIRNACQQFDGVLVGTALMRAQDRVSFLQTALAEIA